MASRKPLPPLVAAGLRITQRNAANDGDDTFLCTRILDLHRRGFSYNAIAETLSVTPYRVQMMATKADAKP